jgi:hypothetical protein
LYPIGQAVPDLWSTDEEQLKMKEYPSSEILWFLIAIKIFNRWWIESRIKIL